MIHPNEEQLQQYLDQTRTADTKDIEQHLHNCSACRDLLASYRKVYQAIAVDPIPELSAGFSQRVITTLKKEYATSANIKEYLYSGAAVTIALITLFVLTKPFDIINRILLVIGRQFSIFTDSLKPLLGYRIDLILIICLILILVEILDYKFLRPRLRHIR